MRGSNRIYCLFAFMNDEFERKLFAEWKVNATLPASFNSTVWQRIERQRQFNFVDALNAWLNLFFAKPAVAIVYATIALGIGLIAGNLQASSRIQKHHGEIQTRYIQSVDPYAKLIER